MQPDNTDVAIEGSIVVEPGSELLDDPSAAIETLVATGTPPPPPPGIEETQTRWEYRCKICQLAIKFPTMYKMLHDLVLKDGMSYNSAMAELNAYIKQHQIKLAHFNMVNILGHFNKHVDIRARAARSIVLATQQSPAIPSSVKPLAQYIDELSAQKAQSEVDDYENLDGIRLKITAVMNKLLGEMEEIDKTDNSKKLSKHGLQLFVGLVSETRACIGDLNKMRQSEKLMNTVVQQLLAKMTFSIIPQLLEEYKSLREELKHQKIPDDIIEMVDLRLRTKTAQIIGSTAHAAVAEIQRQFKLR